MCLKLCSSRHSIILPAISWLSVWYVIWRWTASKSAHLIQLLLFCTGWNIIDKVSSFGSSVDRVWLVLFQNSENVTGYRRVCLVILNGLVYKKSRTEDTKSEASVSFISYHLATYFYIGLWPNWNLILVWAVRAQGPLGWVLGWLGWVLNRLNG